MSNVAAGKDTDDEGEKLNDVEKALGKMGIQLRSSIGEWRNFEEVLDEVADKWEHFSEVQRSQIATAIAGTRQQETFRALMNNYDEVFRLTGVAADSTGSATKRMNIYLESVEAKTNELKATWEEFIMRLSQSESYKAFLDLCIKILQNLDKILPVLTTFITLIASQKLAKGITGLLTFLSFKGGNSGIFATIKMVNSGLVTLEDGTTRAATGMELLGAKASIAITTLTALIAVINLAKAAYDKKIQSQLDNVNATQEEINETKNESSSLQEINQKYNEIINSSMTVSEKKSQLKELQLQLNSVYNDEKKQIDLVNGSYENQIDVLKKLQREKLLEQKTEYQKSASDREKLLSTQTSNMLGKKEDYSSDIVSYVAGVAQRNNSTLSYTNGGEIRLDSTAANLVKIYRELTEYQKKLNEMGYTGQAQQIGDMFNYHEKTEGVTNGIASPIFGWLDMKSIQEDYEKFIDTMTQEEESLFNDFKINNEKAYNEYQDILIKRYELKQKYDSAATKEEKSAIKSQLNELENSYNKAYNNLYFSGAGTSKKIRELLDGAFSSFSVDIDKLNDGIDWSQLGVSSTEVEKTLKNVSKELSETGDLSQDTKQYLYELYKLVWSTGDETWIAEISTMLEEAGVNAEKLKVALTFKDEKDNVETATEKIKNLKEDISNQQSNVDKQNARAPIKEQSLGGVIWDGIPLVGASFRDSVAEEFGGNVETDLDRVTKQIEADRKSANEALSVAEKNLSDYIAERREKMASLVEEAGGDTSEEWYQNLLGKFEEDNNWEEFLKGVEEHLTKTKELAEDTANALEAVGGIGGHQFNIPQSVGTDEQFFDVADKIADWEKLSESVKDGTNLTAEELDDLAKYSEKIARKLTDGAKITSDDIKDLVNETSEAVEEDLDAMQEYFDDTLDYIDKLVKGANFGEDFPEKVEEAFEDAKDALEKGEDLDFEFNPTVATDTGALTELAEQLEALQEDFEIGRVTEDDFNAGLIDMAMEMGSTSEQSALLNAILAGEDGGLISNWNILDQEQLNALASLAGYESAESMMSQSTLPEVLSTLSGKWNELDQDQQNALASLLNYINQYSAAPATVQQLLAEATGAVKAKTYSGAINTGVRKAQLGAARTPKKSGGGGSKGSGSKNNYTAEDAAEDLKDILNDIEDYERDIEADLEDQTEELINHYNLQRNKLDLLKEELDYYDDIYDSVEDTTKWLNNQLNILDEESKKVAELQNSSEKIMAQRDKIYKENSGYNVASWFDEAMNETLAYGDLINSFEYRKKAIEEETAKKMRDVYNSVSGSTDKDTISDAKKKIKNIEDEADLKIKELDKEKEKVENIYDSVEKLNDAWKDNQEAIRDSLQELNDRIKETRDELIDQMMEQLERAVDRMNNSIEKDATRLEQLKDVQESYNDILNDTIETQQELEDELKANMDTYQYLDDTMRQLMFNEDDYKQLSKVLEGVQEDIADIWQDHYEQISSLTDDEMYKAEYITNETERQLAAKQKEYDLAKAELDVAKAQTNLQNTLNERNTRVWNARTNSYEWVANPDAVKEARQQVADAEREKTRLEREAEQQKLLDQLDRFIDADNLQIDENNEYLERIQEAIEQETEEVKSIEEALNNIEKAGLPALNTVLVGALGADGGTMTALLKNINKSQSELAAALRGQTIEQAIAQLKSGSMKKDEFNELVKRLGYSFNETTGMITTQDGTFAAHYSGWTKKSNADKQLTTAPNGVQVTGNQNSSSTTSIASADARAKNNNLEQIAREVWLGKWGNGADRKRRLEAAGYSYSDVQALVNKGYNYFFDQGGLATGIGFLPKDTQLPERVLSPRQTKAFENLVANLTSNPVLSALSKVPSISSKFEGLSGETNNSKNYYFRDFTVKADDIEQFISSIETMMPMKK